MFPNKYLINVEKINFFYNNIYFFCDIYLSMSNNIKNIIKKAIILESKKTDLNQKNGDLELIRDLKSNIEKKIKKVYYDITGEICEIPKIDIKIDDSIKDGKIAGFIHPKNGENGLMGIKSKALKDKEYLKWVITHELIHACIGEDLPSHKEHSGLFKKIADKIGLPKEYQD
jgi:hypothetical protein